MYKITVKDLLLDAFSESKAVILRREMQKRLNENN